MEICNRKQNVTSTRLVKNYSRVLAASLVATCRKLFICGSRRAHHINGVSRKETQAMKFFVRTVYHK